MSLWIPEFPYLRRREQIDEESSREGKCVSLRRVVSWTSPRYRRQGCFTCVPEVNLLKKVDVPGQIRNDRVSSEKVVAVRESGHGRVRTHRGAVVRARIAN